MKKFLIKSLVIILTLNLAMPATALAKNKIRLPHWRGFDYELTGKNGSGTITITDSNNVFSYYIVNENVNGHLSNLDVIVVKAVNRGGNTVKVMNIVIKGLPVKDSTEENTVEESSYEFSGYNGEGTIKITDNNAEYDYSLDDPSLNGRLRNGQVITVHLTKDGKTAAKQKITVSGLTSVRNTEFSFMDDSSAFEHKSWVFRFRNGSSTKVKIIAKALQPEYKTVFQGDVSRNSSAFFEASKKEYPSKPVVILMYYDMDNNLLGVKIS